MQSSERLANFWKTQAGIGLAAIQMYIIVSEWAKSTMRPCEASNRRGGKVWIRGFLYGKHLQWSQRYCAFTVVWLRYLQNYMANAVPIAHPACPGTLLWVIQWCKSTFRNMSPFPKAVTLFSGGTQNKLLKQVYFVISLNVSFPLKIKSCKLFTSYFIQNGWMLEPWRSVFSQNVIINWKEVFLATNCTLVVLATFWGEWCN